MSNAMSFTITTPNDREVVFTRRFSAPRAVVWDAMTKPAMLRTWLLGPPGWEFVQCDNDVRPGGTYRWAWKGPNGEQMAMHGVYREVVPHQKMVRTETFDMGCPTQSGEQIGTLALAERDGATVMTLTVRYPSTAARDGAIASGMEHGMAAGYTRLDEVLAAPVR